MFASIKMRIGNRIYKIKKSDCWLVFPSITLTVNIWTDKKTTYLLTESIRFKNPQDLIATHFQSEFTIQEIDNIDSTLLENGETIEIWNQKVKFDIPNLFKFKNVSVTGETTNKEQVEINSKTVFLGFEVWKMKGYQVQVKEIENSLREMLIPFKTTYEEVNELIRIEIKKVSKTI